METIKTTLPINDLGLIESITRPLYQSTFLPIFRQAELEIKSLVVMYFYYGKSSVELKTRVFAIIEKVNKQIPLTLVNRDAYIDGLVRKVNILVGVQYKRAILNYQATRSLFIDSLKIGTREPLIRNPYELVKAIEKTPRKYIQTEMWAKAKGSVNVESYADKIKQYINGVSKETMTTSELGKKPISLWQKAELDIRHEHQMEMLDKLKSEGVEYAWLSSHPDCSKRCEKWQGKLVSLNKHATMSGFRIGKLDGIWVYSLTDIMAQKDKYGYENNIISGFNCRHKLYEYRKGEKPTEHYSKKDIEKERKVNARCRELERQIRELKTKERLFKNVNPAESKRYKKLADSLTSLYKNYCERNGFAYYIYRIN